MFKKIMNFIYTHTWKKNYVDEKGGKLHLKQCDVMLDVPPGALTKGCILSIAVIAHPTFKTLFKEDGYPRITPIIKCEPVGIKFQKEVRLIMPHCRLLNGNERNVFGGLCGNIMQGGEIEWAETTVDDTNDVGDHCCLSISHFSYFFCNVKNMEGKVIQAMPIARLVTDISTKREVLIWFCNSDESSMELEGKPALVDPDEENAAFKVLKQRIAEILVKRNCVRVATGFNLGQAVIEGIKGAVVPHYPGDRLLDELENRKLFGPNDVLRMYQVCNAIDLQNVAGMILQYRQDNDTVESIQDIPVPSQPTED